MKNNLSLFTLIAFAATSVPGYAQAAKPEPCPISFSRLDMPYKHEGGMSTPTVELSFTNQTRKKIVRAKFGLILLNEQGNATAYDQGLTFTAGAEPGKLTNSKWELDMEKVDMQRNGETVFLKSVRFEDNTTWQDDGNERCRDDVDYGPK